jgi:hypothetical protein
MSLAFFNISTSVDLETDKEIKLAYIPLLGTVRCRNSPLVIQPHESDGEDSSVVVLIDLAQV